MEYKKVSDQEIEQTGSDVNGCPCETCEFISNCPSHYKCDDRKKWERKNGKKNR